jgi:hypothetical protein
MNSRPPINERWIFYWDEEGVSCELELPELVLSQLTPRLQRRRDIEWLGIIRRAKGAPGAVGRLKATGAFVEAFGRSISTMRPSVAAALSAALDHQLKAIMSELIGRERQACGGSVPAEEKGREDCASRPIRHRSQP